MSNTKIALVAGGTGLVGGELLKLLSTDDNYGTIIALVRKKKAGLPSEVQQIEVDFDQLENDLERTLGAENFSTAADWFCCLGTTIKKAGSKDAFRTVDHHYPVSLARLAARHQGSFYVVSSMGASSSSSFFYNQVKGDMEAELSSLNLKALHIFQPSLLLGNRDESRPGEKLAQQLFPVFNWLMRGPLKKYRGISGEDVARAMLQASTSSKTSSNFGRYDSAELAVMAQSYKSANT